MEACAVISHGHADRQWKNEARENRSLDCRGRREFREILLKIWVISVPKKFREIWVTNGGHCTCVMPLPAAGEENLQTGCLEPGSSCFFREIFTPYMSCIRALLWGSER